MKKEFIIETYKVGSNVIQPHSKHSTYQDALSAAKVIKEEYDFIGIKELTEVRHQMHINSRAAVFANDELMYSIDKLDNGNFKGRLLSSVRNCHKTGKVSRYFIR